MLFESYLHLELKETIASSRLRNPLKAKPLDGKLPNRYAPLGMLLVALVQEPQGSLPWAVQEPRHVHRTTKACGGMLRLASNTVSGSEQQCFP